MKIGSAPSPILQPSTPPRPRSEPAGKDDAVARVAQSNRDAAVVRAEDATRLAAATRALMAGRAGEAVAAQPVDEKRLLDLLA